MATNKWKAAVISGASSTVLLAGLVGYFEGSRPVPYRDVTGKWTNCEGNTHNVDPFKIYSNHQISSLLITFKFFLIDLIIFCVRFGNAF